MSNETIYLRLFSQVEIDAGEMVTLGTLAEIEGSPDYKEKISSIPIKINFDNDDGKKVLSSLLFVNLINIYYPHLKVQVVGNADVLIKQAEKSIFPFHFFKLLYLPAVCILLFVGSAMAIINFHADVNMPTVHQQIFKLITGEENRNPLVLQIPYSIGIGLGMTLFFNHFFKKRFNREPSPLEMEMFNYEENINKYIRAKQKDDRYSAGEKENETRSRGKR